MFLSIGAFVGLLVVRRSLFADVGHALGEHGVHMVVGQRVDDVLAVALELDEAGLLERAQLVRHGALRGADELGEVGDAQFLLLLCGSM